MRFRRSASPAQRGRYQRSARQQCLRRTRPNAEAESRLGLILKGGSDENGMPAAEHTSAHSNRQAHLVELRSICYCRSAMAATHPANAHPDAPRPRNKRQRAINGKDKKSLVLHCSNLWIIAVNRCGTATTAPSLTRRWSGKIRTLAQTRVAPHP